MQNKLNATIQESIITLLCYSDEQGRIIARLIEPEIFEGEYRTIAERAISYWQAHNEAPKWHADDIVGDIISDPHNRRANTIKRILQAMLVLSEHINERYIMDRLRAFVRMQRMTQAIITSAELLQAQQDLAIEQVEEIWNELLRQRDIAFDAGMHLYDISRVIQFLEKQSVEFVTGIKELDKGGIVPSRGAAMLFLAPAKRGKTRFLVNTGKHNWLQRKKILHISLEMPEEQVMQLYYQGLFAIPKRNEPVILSHFEMDDRGRLKGIDTDEVKPDFTLESPALDEELLAHISHFGTKVENLIVKRFPNRSLTISSLIAYLDSLEITEKFMPDVLILDYIGIMKTDPKNPRTSLGRVFEEFRGLCVERNIAGVTAQQTNRTSETASFVSTTHVAEDWSMIGTADNTITYSQTKAERKLGLARLYVGAGRSDADQFGVLITQSYQTGQFAIESCYLGDTYWDILKDWGDGEDMSDDDD